MPATALQKAMSGDKVQGRAAEQALATATSRLKSLASKAANLKESAARGGGAVLGLVETTAVAFGSSMAEGFWGPEKMKIGGKVDWRWLPAGLGALWGLWDAFTGKDRGGTHAMSVGLGFLTSAVSSAGVEAGQAVRRARDEKAAGGGAGGGAPTPATSGADNRAGVERDIEMSPPPGGKRRSFAAA